MLGLADSHWPTEKDIWGKTCDCLPAFVCASIDTVISVWTNGYRFSCCYVKWRFLLQCGQTRARLRGRWNIDRAVLIVLRQLRSISVSQKVEDFAKVLEVGLQPLIKISSFPTPLAHFSALISVSSFTDIILRDPPFPKIATSTVPQSIRQEAKVAFLRLFLENSPLTLTKPIGYL